MIGRGRQHRLTPNGRVHAPNGRGLSSAWRPEPYPTVVCGHNSAGTCSATDRHLLAFTSNVAWCRERQGKL
jgi:hypothetical protein